MIGQLAVGTTIRLRNLELDCVVGDCIGAGGQGEVYRVSVPGGDTTPLLALKWYRPEWSTRQQWTDLVWLASQAPPSESFLWPIDVAIAKAGATTSSFGYVMPLRPARYYSCVDIVSGRVSVPFAPLLTACLRLADAFLSLHAKGLCYRDISISNAFIDPDPDSGDVLISDNDNVAINLEGSVGIRGTWKFMAPEIVRGEALPSVDTDLYSLAVLLFYLLVVSHPLEGRRMLLGGVLDGEDASLLYGWNPLFVFDPNDGSNAPDPERHQSAWKYWTMYPQMLRDLFVRAFTDGLRNPAHRVREGEWRDCLARVIDLLIPCPCGGALFVEPNGRPVTGCWQCGLAALGPEGLPMLLLDPTGERHAVVLNVGRRLFGHHLRRRYDYREVFAEVTRHPAIPDVLGIRNLSSDTWTASLVGAAHSSSSCVVVPPGRNVTVANGTTIEFGTVRGVVRVV